MELVSICNLPDDILGVIFNYLITFRRGWHKVWYQTKLWFSVMLVSKQFLKVGRKVFPPNAFRNLALRKAIENGCVDYVKQLLQDSRIDPRLDNNDCLKVAVSRNNAEIVQLLLEGNRPIS